jgi:hypothetical protein
MKKFTLAIAAVVMGFVMAACNTTSPKETVMKATDEFFAQAEKELNETVVDAQGFMDFFNVMNLDKSEFLQDVMAPYMDEEGNVKGFTEEEWNELQSYIYDRATAYNKVEGAKCAEFLTPAIERYEQAVDAFWVKYEAGEEIDDETFAAMFTELDEAENGVFMFADYDNIPTELQERYSTAAAKHAEMFSE